MADYKVGVELNLLTGPIMNALTLVAGAGGLGAIQSAVDKIGEGFKSWNAFLIGGAGIAASASVLGGLKAIADYSDDLQNKLGKLKLQGLTEAQQTSLQRAIMATSREVGVTPESTAAEATRLQEYFQDPKLVEKWLPTVMRMGVVLGAAGLGERRVAQERITPIMKLMEDLGLTTPDREDDLKRVLDRLTRAMAMSGGVVTPEQIQLAGIYSRTARYPLATHEALSMEHPFITDIMPYYAQMAGRGGQGGGGAAIMSAYQKLVSNKMKGEGVAEARRLGIMGEEGYVKQSHLAAINPYEWVQQVLAPSLKEKGITDDVDIAQHISRLVGSNRLAGDMLTNFAQLGRFRKGVEGSQYERYLRGMEAAPGLEQGAQIAQATMPTEAAKRAAAEWTNAMDTISKALQPEKMKLLTALGDVLKSFAERLEKINPETIASVAKAIGEFGLAIGGLSAAAVVAGLAKLTGWPGILAAIAVAATNASPQLSEFADKMKNNLGIALTGIYHAAEDAGTGLSNFLQKIRDFATTIGILSSRGTPFSDWYHRRHGAHAPPGGWAAPIPPGTLPGLHPGDLLHRSAYTPSGGDKPLTVNNVIYLDGSAIARAVHDYMISGVEHPTQAPFFDGRAGHTSVDHQPITT